MKQYLIAIRSDYKELWRYNLSLNCGCFDDAGSRIGTVTAESFIAPVGSALKCPPADYPAVRILSVETPPCHTFTGYLYLIPHTLPAGTDIAVGTFEVEITLMSGGELLRRERRTVNPWSGASLEFFDQEGCMSC